MFSRLICKIFKHRRFLDYDLGVMICSRCGKNLRPLSNIEKNTDMREFSKRIPLPKGHKETTMNYYRLY